MICSIKRLRAEVGSNALFDISAVDLDGRCCSIYGPSGIGKSTFLKGLANGEAEHSLGSVNFKKLLSFNSEINTIRYIPQHPPRFDFTVDTFFERMLKANDGCDGCADTLKHIISKFELESLLNSKMSEISGGQLHRVHLASALSSSADLLLLDEPSAALDRNNKTILLRLLTEYIEERNGFVICCTHDPNFRWQAAMDHLWRALDFPTFAPLEDMSHDKIPAC